jgi:hypothetical protein
MYIYTDLAKKFCQELATLNLSATQLCQFSTLSEMKAQTSTPNWGSIFKSDSVDDLSRLKFPPQL